MNWLYKKFFFLISFFGIMFFTIDINATRDLNESSSQSWVMGPRGFIVDPAYLVKLVEQGNEELIRQYVEAMSDVNTTLGDLLFSCACVKGHIEIMRLFIRAGLKTFTIYGAFLKAIEYGRVDVVRELIAAGADVNWGYNPTVSFPESNYTPLIHATRYGNIEVMRLLIDAGAGINDLVRKLGVAVAVGDVNEVRLFIRAGVDVNSNLTGITPLMRAIQEPRYVKANMVAALLSAGADFTGDVAVLNSEVQAILSSSFVEFCKNPEAYLAQPREQCVLNELLYYSALAGADTLVKLLLENGADINTVNFNGQFVSRYDLSEVGLQGGWESVLDQAIQSKDGKTTDLIVTHNGNGKSLLLPYFDVRERHKLYLKNKKGCLTTLHSLCLNRLEKSIEPAS
jgi:ankyrin repeat protein